MYSTEDLKALSIEEITNLVNQIYDEKDLYKKKYEGLLAAKKRNSYISQRAAAQVADKEQNTAHQWVKAWMDAYNPVKSINSLNSKYKIKNYGIDDDDDNDPYSDPFEDLLL